MPHRYFTLQRKSTHRPCEMPRLTYEHGQSGQGDAAEAADGESCGGLSCSRMGIDE